ncbi:MAG: VCBS repeat-containing protein [Actinobacteria bacterium]|nr:VCBS repeat-containing protein [Actinomycetota bacterium]
MTTTLTPVGTIDRTMGAIGTRPNTTSEAFSSPTLADLTGDGVPEIVAGYLDGVVAAYRATDRSVLWKVDLGSTAVQASPAVADMDGDGRQDVVVGTIDGRVVWLDGPTGRVRMTYREGAPMYCPVGVDCRPHGFFSTPAIADINGDGILDIVAASWDHSLYAWSRGGTLLFRRFLEDTIWSSPAIADIDRDGKPEIVVGGDMYAGNPYGWPPGGMLWVLTRTGANYPGYPKVLPGMTIWSTPAIADLNQDGWLDIVVGNGLYSPYGDSASGRLVRAYTARTGAPLPGWPVEIGAQVGNAVVAGDVDGDGRPEVAFASNGGWVFLYNGDGTRRFSRCVRDDTAACNSTSPTHATVAMADVDADGRQELVLTSERTLRIVGSDGTIEASVKLSGSALYAPPNAPAIGEVNGRTIIVQQGTEAVGHTGAVRSGDLGRLFVLTTGQPLCRAAWPMFKQAPNRRSSAPAAPAPWRPFACARDFVARQYADFLGRTPDAGGLATWVSRMQEIGWPGDRVIDAFIHSPEFGGTVAPVVRLYLGVTGSPPGDAGAVRGEADRIRLGTSLGTVAGELVAGSSLAAASDGAFVAAVYANLLGRAPTAAEAAAATGALASGTARGAWLAALAGGPAAAGRLDPQVQVTMAYLGMLGRAPDPGGFAYWVGQLQSGTSVRRLLALFQASAEYRGRVT